MIPDGHKDPNDPAAKALYANAKKMHAQAARVNAMLDLARSEPGMTVVGRLEFNRDPWLLGVKNGVLDLRAGKLVTARPEQYITRQAGATFSHNAYSTRFEAFLSEVFPEQPEVISFIQRWAFYTLTGLTREHKLLFLWGGGRNGKSVLAETMRAVMGEYAAVVGTALLDKDATESERERYIVLMMHARMILASESGAGMVWDDKTVKRGASSDAINARYLYGEVFNYDPTGKLWFLSNHKPIIRGEDAALWERFNLVHFTRKFLPTEQDRDLQDKLKEAELEGILAWAVRGGPDYQRIGLAPPKAVGDALAAYRAESDVLGQWIEECCEQDGKADWQELFGSYQGFIKELGMKPL